MKNQGEIEKLVPSSYDIIGSIAIVELPEGIKLRSKLAREIGQAILARHKNVKTVLAKASARYGKFRLRKLRLIAGENRSVTLHKENKLLLKLNVRKVYFSPREQTERLRIANEINEFFPHGLNLAMVFFAGIGCYPLLIAKRCKVRRVVGIELNPVAVKYFKENLKLNKVKNCIVIHGDVAREARKFRNACDVVVMPYPEGAYRYLKQAFGCLKDNGICFFYAISEEKDLFNRWKAYIARVAEKQNCRVRFLRERKVLPYAPRKYKVMICFRLLKEQ